MEKLIHLIAAARPNFMKVAPLYHSLKNRHWARPVIVHTGQHYDINMSDAFFQDLALPEPDICLDVGSGSHAEQTGRVMIAYEKVLEMTQPDMVIVVGDVNSTLACALAASKIVYSPKTGWDDDERNGLPKSGDENRIPRPVVAHLEAGLRSFDRSMPEEINRLVTDAIADVLWTPSHDADENLLREGVPEERIIRVGNIMIDSLEMMRERIESEAIRDDLGLRRGDYAVVTIHRPSNVDDPETLERLIATLDRISRKTPLVFPVHPRTRKSLERAGLTRVLKDNKKITTLDPLSYVRFMRLVFDCRMVITDSGGVQEETTYLGVPCLTMRSNTERPITVEMGTNQLCDIDDVEEKVARILNGGGLKRRVPPLWDGKTAERVAQSVYNVLNAPSVAVGH